LGNDSGLLPYVSGTMVHLGKCRLIWIVVGVENSKEASTRRGCDIVRRTWFAIQWFDEETETWRHVGIHQNNLKNAQAELERIRRAFKKRKPLLRIKEQNERERR